jgi:hypothetical protein
MKARTGKRTKDEASLISVAERQKLQETKDN